MVQSNRLRLHTLTSSAKVDVSKYKMKKYKHFDNRVSINKVINDIKNPSWVVQHGFFPFIHFKIEFYKYSRIEKRKKPKTRDIYYASHLDSYIYKYYGDMLNNKYNEVVKKLEINEVATAYRNNLNGKSNIHFAKEVIDFIKKFERSFIYVADFTSFFDTLDHKYLKRQLQVVLNTDKLPDDYFTIFKNITKFSWAEKRKIEEVLNKKYKSKEKRKKLTRLFDEKDFRKFRKSAKDNIQNNKNDYGIPQGAGLSSVCSNIYLLDFDKKINDYVKDNNGLYRRYCDDLIIVIPFEEDMQNFDYKNHMKFIEKAKNDTPRLVIQDEKTKKFIYSNNNIYDESLNPSILDYLGFAFNGNSVKLREKSLFKYYSRAYKKVRLCNWKSEKCGRKKHRKSLYINYTHLGLRRKGHGNFLSYALRAQQIFDENPSTINLMESQVKNHWRKINKRLKK
ncbi:reverse transcriptase domain-containing protein [Niallia sp. JL1B1071]|uniref:reverse transcriptase domain-containing protein n=1 Tax=Niallia tiangongensis TaxID=3237105 RepID=UPI0037DC8D32